MACLQIIRISSARSVTNFCGRGPIKHVVMVFLRTRFIKLLVLGTKGSRFYWKQILSKEFSQNSFLKLSMNTRIFLVSKYVSFNDVLW